MTPLLKLSPNMTHSAPLLFSLFIVIFYFAALHSAVYAQPSFDCRKANSRVEKLICTNQKLSVLDVRLNELYKTVIRNIGSNKIKRVRSAQRRWIARRGACAKKIRMNSCVTKLFNNRIGELDALLSPQEPIVTACKFEKLPLMILKFRGGMGADNNTLQVGNNAPVPLFVGSGLSTASLGMQEFVFSLRLPASVSITNAGSGGTSLTYVGTCI